MIQTTAIVRDRGQLTIPDEIRRLIKWITPRSVVTIRISTQDELIVKPYQTIEKQTVDWNKIWENIQLTRSFKGTRGNLSQFIVGDRQSH